MNDFTTFQSFYTKEEAMAIADLLEKNGVTTRVEKAKMLDTIIGGDDQDKKIYLNIKSSDFNRASKILEEEIKSNLSQIGDDYYLYSFSDDELNEIISTPDEWSRQDYFIAKKILDERGVHLTEEKISTLKGDRINAIGRPEAADSFWITVGYFFAFMGGLFGFFFGLAYLHAKKILPDGTRVYVYDENTRRHGRNILIISCIVIILGLISGFQFHWFSSL
jgi:hypothetical protein